MCDRGKWLPIETAPKDGRQVDLWCVGGLAAIKFYCPEYCGVTDQPLFQGRVTHCWWKDGAWRPKSGLTKFHQLEVTPTHWQPIPAPPPPEAGNG